MLRTIEDGVYASVGSVGGGYDYEPAKSTISLFKTEKPHLDCPS